MKTIRHDSVTRLHVRKFLFLTGILLLGLYLALYLEYRKSGLAEAMDFEKTLL